MPLWCWTIRRDLTALVDDELRAARAAAVRAHLERCVDCVALYRDIEEGVAQQREILPLLASPADVAVESVLRQLTHRAVDESERNRRRWWQPAVVGATAVATLVIVARLGLLDPVLIAVGFEDPPEVVAEQPELFRDYALFEYLDAWEHFEDIRNPASRRSPDDEQNG